MSFNAKVLDELHKMVLEESESVLNVIAAGVAINDLPTYKEQVGRLYAYRRVLGLFEESVKIVETME